MNERIKELAEQAGWKEMSAKLWGAHNDGCMSIYALERFAELVRQDERNLRRTKKEWSDHERAIAADEREACAKVCDKASYWDGHVAANCAAAIRARKEST